MSPSTLQNENVERNWNVRLAYEQNKVRGLWSFQRKGYKLSRSQAQTSMFFLCYDLNFDVVCIRENMAQETMHGDWHNTRFMKKKNFVQYWNWVSNVNFRECVDQIHYLNSTRDGTTVWWKRDLKWRASTYLVDDVALRFGLAGPVALIPRDIIASIEQKGCSAVPDLHKHGRHLILLATGLR